MKLYPVHVLLEGKTALVVGGGPVAAAKAGALLQSGVRELVVIHFPEGAFGDFQTTVSWLIFWLWGRVEQMPPRCPECGMRHPRKFAPAHSDDDKA